LRRRGIVERGEGRPVAGGAGFDQRLKLRHQRLAKDPIPPEWNRWIIRRDWFGLQLGAGRGGRIVMSGIGASDDGVPMSPFRMSVHRAVHHDKPTQPSESGQGNPKRGQDE
jgi:hypothetical protein